MKKEDQAQGPNLQNSASFIFFSKLKEQSFTVVLMIAIVYYQHTAWQNDREDMMREIHAKEAQIMALMEKERERLIEREKALRDQRDQFVEMLKEEAAWNKAELRLKSHRTP